MKRSGKGLNRDMRRIAESAMVFGAASHPYRLAALEIVSREPRRFTEIARGLGVNMVTEPGLLSFHLRKLLDAGLVGREGHTYVLTDLGSIVLSLVRDLTERKQEEAMVGMKIEEATARHVPGIREFFREEYGASEEWLGNIDRTYPMLIGGRKLESEDGHILSLVALVEERVLGFVCGRIVRVDSPRISLGALEGDEDFLRFLKGWYPDLERLPEMSQEDRSRLRETLVSRIAEAKGLSPEDLADAKGWRDRAREAWIDVLWSVEHNERFVKKRMLSEFMEKAGEQGALTVQTFLRNPDDAEIVRGLGFAKLDGEFHASFIGPGDLLRKWGVTYQTGLGNSMAFWDFADGATHSGMRITDAYGDLGFTLDFSGLEGTDKPSSSR